METSSTPVSELVTSNESPEVAMSPKASESKTELSAILAEARNTKEMLEHFRGAVAGGRFDGASMLSLAKGMAFIDAILNQNKAHIANLQERLKEAK